MAIAKSKEAQGASVRTVELRNPRGVRCEMIDADGHTIISDEPVERGGDGTASAPLMYFTASLASCQAVQIRKVAKAMRLDLGAIEIKASAMIDRVEGVDKNDKVMRFCAAELVINIETDESAERIERLKTISEDMCPVGNLFSDAGYQPNMIWNILPKPKMGHQV